MAVHSNSFKILQGFVFDLDFQCTWSLFTGGVQQRRKRKRSTKHHGSALCVRETCFTRECSDNTQQHTVSSDGINRECQNWASNAECYDESQNNFVQSRAAFAVNDCCEEPPYKRMCPVSSSPNADTGPDPVELDDLFAEVFGDSILG